MVPRITIFGSLNMDLVTYVSHYPLPGETLISRSFTTFPGGKGANQAVACAKLSRARDLLSPSVNISMIGAVGADTYGIVLLDSLASFGVDVGAVTICKEQTTGIAMISVDESDGQNRIILSPEANYFLKPADLKSLPDPKPSLLIMQLEIRFDTAMRVLQEAKAADVPVLLNPAPAQKLPVGAYQDLSHLIVNETEAALLAECTESDLRSLIGLRRVTDLFISRGVRNVIITLGGRGSYFATRIGTSALIPAAKAAVVDTTAAGDTFIGSYALAAVAAAEKDFDIAAAVSEANRAAAMTISRKGALVSIPWRDEL